MGFSYSNSCDLFGPKFCDVMRNVGRNSNTDRSNEKEYDDLDKMIEKLDEITSKLFL